MRAAIALIVFFAIPAFAQGFDIKGITPGTSYEELMTKFPSLECKKPVQTKVAARCDYLATLHVSDNSGVKELNSFGGAPTSWISFYFDDDSKIGSVYILLKSSDFATVSEAASVKFGKPTRTEDTEIKNRMGAAFQQKQHLWVKSGETLTIKKYAGDIKNMSVTLSSSKFAEESKRRAAIEATGNAKDL